MLRLYAGLIVLLAVAITGYLFGIATYFLPSGSMRPTFEVGDYIAVNKLAYALRLPGLDITLAKRGEPQRGDIVVLKYSERPAVFIERIVGLPGDHVVMQGDVLSINGATVPAVLQSQIPEDHPWEQYLGQVLGQHHFTVRQLVGVGPAPSVDVIVPSGQYFVLGDNRNESADSRYKGLVPEGRLLGRVFYVWIHKKPGLNLPTFGRNGMVN